MSDDVIERFIQQLKNEGGQEKEPEPADPSVDRIPCMLVLDRSDSTRTSGDIEQINDVVERVVGDICNPKDDAWKNIRNAVDLAIVSYGGNVRVDLEWTQGVHLTPAMFKRLNGESNTPMAAALSKASEMLLRRLAYYGHHDVRSGVGYIINVTDGAPSDMSPGAGDAPGQKNWQNVKMMLDRFETMGSRKNAYARTFHFASRGADRNLLRQLAFKPDSVIDLSTADFGVLLEFIRISLLAAVEDDT